MNVKTGEVLAMANLPDFDPNQPRVIIGRTRYHVNELKDDRAEASGRRPVYRRGDPRQILSGGRTCDNLPEERAEQ